MRIIEAPNVDLISPFPYKELPRVYGWMHCYRTLTETDDTPKTQEEYVRHFERISGMCVSYGVIDKNHLTNSKHEAPLVGMLMFEPAGNRGGFLHFATARRAWHKGLIDEAAWGVIRDLFENIPDLTRIGAYTLDTNKPAKSLCKRLGMKLEGVLEDAAVQHEKPVNVVYFGLTRRNWLCHGDKSQGLVGGSSEGCLEEVQRPPQTAPVPALTLVTQTQTSQIQI